MVFPSKDKGGHTYVHGSYIYDLKQMPFLGSCMPINGLSDNRALNNIATLTCLIDINYAIP